MIEMLSKHFQGDICVGAGTVMNIEQVEAAAKLAQNIISPHTDLEVIKRTVELNGFYTWCHDTIGNCNGI